MNIDYKKIGSFIAELRKEKKLTQEKLAEELFVDRTTISKWELGENNINTETLLKLSKIFDVTLNEMILGEKLNKNNIDDINNITVNVINKNTKFKKYLISSIVLIIILIVSFLSYYFISTYNSIVVYEIEGENELFSVQNGIMVTSKERTYVNLGTIDNVNDVDIISVKLYYKKNNDKIIFYESNDLNGFYISKYDKDSIVQYSDLKYIIANMYLEIIFNSNEVSTIKLELLKSYSNNNLFVKNTKNVKQKEINELNYDIPEYIKKNFKFDNQNNYYYFEESQNDKYINCSYFAESNVYIVNEIYDDYIEKYIYSYPDDITYNKSSLDGSIVKEFVYSTSNQKCITDNCSNEKIKYFEDEYLSKIKFK